MQLKYSHFLNVYIRSPSILYNDFRQPLTRDSFGIIAIIYLGFQ